MPVILIINGTSEYRKVDNYYVQDAEVVVMSIAVFESSKVTYLGKTGLG